MRLVDAARAAWTARTFFHLPYEHASMSAAISDQTVDYTCQRHGAADASLRERFPLGSRLRVLPNHACATGAQFDRYHLLRRDGGLDIWPRFSGW